MKDLISSFPDQLRKAVEIARGSAITASSSTIQSVVVSGMGGSGIGGKLVAQLVANELVVPMSTNSTYTLPAFIGPQTLLIISSYSGNTEETLATLEEGIKRNAIIVCITTGGKVLELAKKHGLQYVVVPGGNPPRAALGFSLVQQLGVLYKMNLLSDHMEDLLNTAILLDSKQDDIQSTAKEITKKLVCRIPVIYSDVRWESVVIRFRQQLNENAKILCWHQSFPELNHNEIVGWTLPPKDLALLILRDKQDLDRNQQRIEISKEIIADRANSITEVWAEGNSPIQKALYFIHLLDWVSYFLCIENDQDPMAIEAIDRLKNELSKQ